VSDTTAVTLAGHEPALVTVVVVAYNAERHLVRCLDSLLRQTYPRIEILVVDNASSDASVVGLEERFPQVSLIQAGANLGYAAGNNLGFAHAQGDFIAVLNPDTEATPGWLAALVVALEADPSAGLATSKILLFNQRDQINTCGNDVHYTGLAFCRGLGHPASHFAQPQIVPAVSGAAFLARRTLLEQIGGFNERFFTYLEDTDLSWRAALAGYHCLFVPNSQVYHHYTTRVGAAKIFYLERNRYLMLLQNCRWPTLLLLLPALLLAECVTWGYLLLRGPDHISAKIRAYLWVLGHGHEIAVTRRRVQRTRRVPDRVILSRMDWHLAVEQVAPNGVAALARRIFDGPFQLGHRALVALVAW
jgi:GT2 family glycosyltransferase